MSFTGRLTVGKDCPGSGTEDGTGAGTGASTGSGAGLGVGVTLAGGFLAGATGAGAGSPFFTSVSASKIIVVSPLSRFFTGGAAVAETVFELVSKMTEDDLFANEVKRSEPSNRQMEENRRAVIMLI